MLHPSQRTRRVHLAFILCILTSLITLSACSDRDRSDIRTVLDARDSAISNHDLKAYSALLMPGYDNHEQSELEIINRMRQLFEQFEKIEMSSGNRTIRITDHQHAECEQNYLLHVQANGSWRQLNQRERIKLIKTESGWKISGGL